VNGWGFRRITHGPDYNAYYHDFFLRGLPHLLKSMTRLTSKDVANRQKEDVTVMPDFYALSREYPLPELPAVHSPKRTAPPPPPPQGPTSPLATANIASAQTAVSSAGSGDASKDLQKLKMRRSEIIQRIITLIGGSYGEALLTRLAAVVGLEDGYSIITALENIFPNQPSIVGLMGPPSPHPVLQHVGPSPPPVLPHHGYHLGLVMDLDTKPAARPSTTTQTVIR
jgi:hypothetical protein